MVRFCGVHSYIERNQAGLKPEHVVHKTGIEQIRQQEQKTPEPLRSYAPPPHIEYFFQQGGSRSRARLRYTLSLVYPEILNQDRHPGLLSESPVRLTDT